ncbi:MAG: BsaA family SipW-dependent biofilm matrix protein, partial [Oscillospiraceae bacterium]
MKKVKGKKQNKVAIAALTALFTVGIVAGSLAYFSTNSEFKNIFTVGKPSGGIVETFENPSNEQVARGGIFPKSAVATNTGETPLLARAKITAAWTSTVMPAPTFTNELATGIPAAKLMFGAAAANDPTDGATADFSVNKFTGFACDVADDTVAKVTKDAKWYYSTDGYFYCKDKLQPNTTSTSLLKALSISNTIADATTVYEIKYNNGTADVT